MYCWCSGDFRSSNIMHFPHYWPFVMETNGVPATKGSIMRWFDISFVHYNDVIMGKMASQITSLTIVYSTVYLSADLRKHQNSAPLAFMRGIHRRPVNSPHKGPVTRKMFPFDDVIRLSAWTSCSTHYRVAGHWGRHDAYVTSLQCFHLPQIVWNLSSHSLSLCILGIMLEDNEALAILLADRQLPRKEYIEVPIDRDTSKWSRGSIRDYGL